MVAALRVLDAVAARLADRRRRGPAGLLVGLRDGSDTLVVGSLHCEPDDLATTQELAGALLPHPLALVGCFGQEGAPLLQLWTEPGGVAATYAAAAADGDGDGTAAAGPGGGDAVCWAVKQGGKLCPCEAQLVPASEACNSEGLLQQLAEGYVPVRCTAEVVLETSGSRGGGASALQPAFAELEEQLCGASTVYLAEAAAGSVGSGGGAAQPRLPSSAPFVALGASWAAPTLLRPLVRCGSGSAAAAPRLGWQPGAGELRHSSLCLDVLCYVPQGMPAAEAVQSIVRPAVRRQLAAMRLDADEAAAAGAALSIPNLPPQRALHFRPPGFPHHVTLVYPLPRQSIEAEEEALVPRRKALHRLLGLPTDRPLLRVANAASFDGAAGSGTAALEAALESGGVGGRPRLRDVHVGLPAPPLGGSVHLVQGSYDYFHYMQDKFDDSGWGCAYRSLQTLCSWFARQGYAARPPPSHREIQAALVQLGDKEASFIGSKQWIGAIEIGYVLDALLGVQHKVLSVGSGDDMPSLARQIAHHFDTQGTPVMIGGGVLAYTLLGVDFDERSGRCAFLILDPHYTGGEDVKKVHAGQWVAWKQPGDKAAAGGDLFVAGSFYNLLCPQRPTTV